MNRKWTIWMAAGLLVLGAAVLLYPVISSAINRQHGSYAIQQLQQHLEELDSAEMESALKEAEQYNVQLKTSAAPDENRYANILDFGNGIMGYITIEKIDLMLPIYHGVGTEVLEKGVGHLPSSAFPIGGEGNHAVLTGHTGLPSAQLFTELAELAEGDEFLITVGTHESHYLVDQILVVLPQETEALMPASGQDYCTLVTCTPYGVNSHRLLVRGSRTEVPDDPAKNIVQEAATPEKDRGWMLLFLLPLLGLLLIWKRKKGRHG